MGADQQFCLRWNNFHTNITSAFESLRDDEDFVDITLACEGRQIKAHRMVLSACSPYFRSLLRGNPCKHPIVFLKDVTFANLASILDFMYHGEVNVSHHELATFLKTAEALRVRGLAEDDNKKKEGDTCTESSSPPPPREAPEPCSPGRPEEPPDGVGGGGGRSSVGENMPSSVRSSDSSGHLDGPPTKRQRRRSGGTGSEAQQSLQQDMSGTINNSSSTDIMNSQQQQGLPPDGVRDSVKNEPEEYVNEDEENSQLQQQSQQVLSIQSAQQQITTEDIKLDSFNASSVAQDDSTDYNMPSESISNRNQAAMQQLQDTFSSFIPAMAAQGSGAGGGFIPHSTSGGGEHGSRSHPPFTIEGVQGLPPGISAIPGSSLTQGGSSSSSQDASAQGHGITTSTASSYFTSTKISSTEGCVCPFCCKVISNKHNLKTHITDKHTVQTERFPCKLCGRNYSTKHSLATHTSTVHRGKASPRGNALGGASSTVGTAAVARASTSLVSPSSLASMLPPPSQSMISSRIISPSSFLNPVSNLSSSPNDVIDSKEGILNTSLPLTSTVYSGHSLPSNSDGINTGGGNALGSGVYSSSLAELVANLPPSEAFDSSSHDQIQAMAQSLAQSFPSNQSFQNFPEFD